MTTYKVTSQQQLDDYSVLTTLVNTEIAIGQTITVASLATTAFNGSFTVFALPQYLYLGVDSTTGVPYFDTQIPIANQVMYYNVQATDVNRVEIYAGTIAYTQTCTWITAGNIEDWIGIGTATAADTTFLTQCAAAANIFCYRRRQEAGYFDSLTTSPSSDVTLGTIMYGGALYRQRGAISDFAAFDGMSTGNTYGLSPIVKQLLGVDRPAVA